MKISSDEDRSAARKNLAMIWNILNSDKDGLAKILRGGEVGEVAVSQEEEWKKWLDAVVEHMAQR